MMRSHPLRPFSASRTIWLVAGLILGTQVSCGSKGLRGPSGRVTPLKQEFSTWEKERETQGLKIALGSPLYMFKGREKCMRCSGYDMENQRSQSVQVCLSLRDSLAPGENPDTFYKVDGELTLIGVEKTPRSVSNISRMTPLFEATTGHKIYAHYGITATDTPLTYTEFFHADDNDRSGSGEKYFGPARLARCLIQFGDAFQIVQKEPKFVEKENPSKLPYTVYENEQFIEEQSKSLK